MGLNRPKETPLYLPAVAAESRRNITPPVDITASRDGIDNAFLAGVFVDADDLEFDHRNQLKRHMVQVLCRCVPNSEELSTLTSGSMLPHFLHALRRYHPRVWFFAEGSRKFPRYIRFLISFMFILTSLFVTTILYDINYLSTMMCPQFNLKASACLGTPPNILSGKPICTYDYVSNLCTRRQPPDTPVFLILFAFLTVLMFVPFNVIFTLVLTRLCSKRPRVEALGLNFFEWLGSATSRTGDQPVSATEKSERVTAVVRNVQAVLYHCCERKAMGLRGPDEVEGMEYVLQKVGLVISGENRIELTTFSRLWWANTHQAIRHRVETSLKDAREVQQNMEQYSENPKRESYLIQHFLIYRFSFLYRVALSSYFAHRAWDVPQAIHPILWILAWLFVIGSLVFFFAWILWWGNAYAHSVIISNWGLNFALINILEVFYSAWQEYFSLMSSQLRWSAHNYGTYASILLWKLMKAARGPRSMGWKIGMIATTFFSSISTPFFGRQNYRVPVALMLLLIQTCWSYVLAFQ